jgi:hypothetical protein
MSNRILILNRTTISTVDTTVDISQEPVMETELFIPSLFAEKITMRPSNPRIDKWLQPSTSMVVTLRGDIQLAVNQSNTLSLWIDLQRGIPVTSAIRHTVIWTAAEILHAEKLVALDAERLAAWDACISPELWAYMDAETESAEIMRNLFADEG